MWYETKLKKLHRLLRELSGGKTNFKKLIQGGGGAFSGSLKVIEGSAKNCTANIYENAMSLIITGSIDTTAHTFNITIKGKTFF